MKPLRLLPGFAATAAALLVVSCMRDRLVSPDMPLPAVLAVDRPTVQLFRFARGRMVAADTVRISNNGAGNLGPVQRLGGVDYQEGRTGWLDARVVNVDANHALLVLAPTYAEEEQAQADRAEVILKGAGAPDLKRVTIYARTLPGAKFEFSVSPAAFTAAPGEPPSSQTLVVRNGGNGVLVVHPPTVVYVGAATGWLTVARTGGSETAPTYAIQADPTGLAGGLHQARLDFASLATEETQALPGSLPVQLNVGMSRLGISTSKLSFSTVYGDQAPPPQVVWLSNAGSGSFLALGKLETGNITYGAGATGWLRLAVDTTRLQVSADPAGIRPGNYAATIQLRSEAGGEQSIQVALSVESPKLTLSTPNLTFGVVRGEAQLPAAQTLRAMNTGSGSVSSLGTIALGAFTPAADWVKASLSGNEITISPDAAAANLSLGTHTTELVVTSAFGGSDTVTVTMAVSRGADVPALVLSATELAFGAVRGEPPPASQVVQVSNAGGGSLGTVSLGSVEYVGASGWLSPSIKDTTITVTLSTIPADGRHQATVRVSSPAGGEVDLRVSLNVTSPVLTLSATSVSFSSEAGGAPGQSQSITLSNTGSGTQATLGGLSAGPIEYGSGSGWLSYSLSGATLTLTLESVPATAGSYTARVPVTSANGGGTSVQVVLTVAAPPTPPDLVVSPTSVNMFAVQGGSDPGSQTLQLSNGGGGTLGAITASSSESWLNATVSGSGVNLSASTGALSGGSHSATVTISSANGGDEDVSVEVLIAAPRLTLSAASASFRAAQGGVASPGLITIEVSNTGAGDFSALGGVSVSETADWLTAATTGGGTGIALAAAPGSLTSGLHTTTVQVSSGAGGDATIAVSVTVVPPSAAPDLMVSPSSVAFAAARNGSNPGGQSVGLLNSGGGGYANLGTPSVGTITYGASAGDWLTATLDNANQEVDLQAQTDSLPVGTHTASFQVTTAQGGSETVSVEFAIDTASAAQLALGAAQVEFFAVLGGSDPASMQVPVLNRGTSGLGKVDLGTIDYASGDPDWLSGSSASGSQLTLDPSIAGLSAGTHTATVHVTSNNGGNASVSVSIEVGEPELTLSARSVSFAATVGGGNPGDETVEISNTGAGTVNDLGDVDPSFSADWLDVTVVGDNVTFDATSSGLDAGVYETTVTLTSDAGGSVDVEVVLTVAEEVPDPDLVLGASSVNFVAVKGAPSPSPVTIDYTNAGGGGQNALGNVTIGSITPGTSSSWLPDPQVTSGSIRVAVNTSGMSSAYSSANVTVNSQQGGSESLTVTVQLVEPRLSVSALALSFTAPAGSSETRSETVTVSNTGGGGFDELGSIAVQSVNYGAGASGWLKAPTTGGSVSGPSVAFEVSAYGLSPGSYSADVQLASTYGGEEAVTVTFTIVRDTDPPRLLLSAPSQRFSALAGGGDPAPQSVELINAGGGSLGALQVGTIAYGPAAGDWLTASIAGTTLTVSAKTGTLAKGEYTASVSITSTQGGSVQLEVTFVVGSPRLTVTPRTIAFADTLGGSGPPPVTVSVANTGGGTLASLGTISVLPPIFGDSMTGWLTAALGGNSVLLAATTGTLPVRLAPYEARVLVTSQHGGEDTVSVAFTVRAGSSPPRLALSFDSVRFATLIGRADPQPQSVTAFNAGGGSLGALSIGDTPAWLRIQVDGPLLTLSPVTAGLSAGQYHAQVIVSSARGGDAELQVAMEIGQPVLRLSTRSITFSDTVGSRDPLRSQVFVSNAGSGTRADLGRIDLGSVSYSAGGAGWLHTLPLPGGTVDNFQATVEAIAADVPEGTSIARVRFTSQWGGADTVTISLTARRPDRSFDLPTIELVRTTVVNGVPVTQHLPGDSAVVTATAHSPAQVALRVGVRNAADTRLTLSGLRVGMPTYTGGKSGWISGAFLDKTSATLAEPAELFVAIEPAALDAGRYEAQLVVRSEAAGLAQVPPVTLRIVLVVQ